MLWDDKHTFLNYFRCFVLILLPSKSPCLCNHTSLSHHFFYISNTGLPFKMQDNPFHYLNYSVSHQHPPSPSPWLFSEPHFAYQTSPFKLCAIMPLTGEEISSRARLVMTPCFPSAAFVTCALLWGTWGEEQGGKRVVVVTSEGEELHSLLHSCQGVQLA